MQTNTILCPTDFSEPAILAMEHASQGAQRAQAKLLLLHVVEPSGSTLGYDPAISKEIAAVQHADRSHAEKKLEELQQQLSRLEIDVATDIAYGSPAEAIVRYAKEKDVDLIVIATNGTTGWRRWVFGSVAEVVVRKTPCPVLVVPAPESTEGA